MTDWRINLHTFLADKTGLTAINAMEQFKEPDSYVSYYALNDETLTTSSGQREFNAVDDNIDVHYTTLPMVALQIDVRGTDSFTKARSLYHGLQTGPWIQELKALGIYFMGVGAISTIPNLQNGYIKPGEQFNLWFGYNNTITTKVDYTTGVTLNGN